MYLLFEILHDITKMKSFFIGWGGGLPRLGEEHSAPVYLVPYTDLGCRGYFGI